MRAQSNSNFGRRVRAGFTLVELIVVIGLMALLATISTSGYFAVQRGMAARGCIQDTASIIRFAMQTCLIDQVPTAVLFYNYRTDRANNGGDAYGRAMAIRMTGRISYVANGGSSVQGATVTGGMLVDEFADWNQSYSHEATTGAKALSTRIFRMQSENELKNGLNKCSSLMYNWVGYASLDRFNSEYMVGARQKVEDFCSTYGLTDNTGSSAYPNGNAYRWGLPFHQKNDGLGPSGWQIGDAYGTQIAEFTLPKNYIFGKKAPQDTKLEPPSDVKALVFWPEKVTSSQAYEFSTQDVLISMLNDVEGKDIVEVGKVDRSVLRDQD